MVLQNDRWQVGTREFLEEVIHQYSPVIVVEGSQVLDSLRVLGVECNDGRLKEETL